MKTMRNQAKHILRAGLAVILVLSMLVSASVMCFAETDTSTETVVKVGIKGKDVSLGEDIRVRFYTDSTTDDGSKLVVKFNDEEYEITQSQYVENRGNAFIFVGVTPQKLGDEMTATLYDADGTQIGDAVTLSVKSYIEELLAKSLEDSGMSKLKYQAMRELCVNMLNYGAAAQTYVDYKTDNLVNKDLSDELKALATEKITVTDTDKAVNGDAWVGAGVRFDYKLGLYYVFKAASADEYTATINGTEVTPKAYEALGEGYYVIRYNSFNATNMNDKVTAKLTKDGAEQTFTYSIKSYVASKGGDTSNVANLVNATYTYGYAAVAYSSEYVITDPTFEENGSLYVDSKGYDFSNSDYGSVELPALNFTDYTAKTDKSGADTDPNVITTFTLNNSIVDYVKPFTSKNCISLDGNLYSQYDVAGFGIYNENEEKIVSVTYDEEKGYTYDVATGETAYPTTHITPYGADLTITGKVYMSPDTTKDETWTLNGQKVTIGTAEKTAKVELIGFTAGTSIRIYGNTTLLVSKDSEMNIESAASYSIYLGANSNVIGGAQLIVDGTLTSTKCIRDTYLNELDETAEYGFIPNIYVRDGSLTTAGLHTFSLQVGSEKEGTDGDLILTGSKTNEKNASSLQSQTSKESAHNQRYVFAKGTLELADNVTYLTYLRLSNTTHVDVRGGMTLNLNNATSVFVLGYSSSSCVNTFYAHRNARYNFSETNTTTTVMKVNTGKGHTYIWDELTAVVDEVEKTVRVVNYTTGTTITSAQCNATIIAANTAITSSETTQGMGTLGEFTQGKYIDANGEEQTVWYQIVE